MWEIVEPVFRNGTTFVFSPEISEDEARSVWVETSAATFVAVDQNDKIAGTYYLKPNQPGLGNHVCNCGYIVSQYTRGQGVASAMCEHSQREAIDRGEDVKSLHARCSVVKLYVSEMVNRVADRMLQIFGGRGYMRENVAERFFRELRVDRIWEGTSEIQRLIIARALIKRGLTGM